MRFEGNYIGGFRFLAVDFLLGNSRHWMWQSRLLRRGVILRLGRIHACIYW